MRRVFLPYCVEAVPGVGHVVLNRNYKPLGMDTRERIDYAPFAVRLRGLTSAVAAKISWQGLGHLDRIWLYDDTCVPTRSAVNWRAYAERLAVLAKLGVEVPG